MTEESLHILGILGSLRRASYNRGLLHAAQEVAPPDVYVTLLELGDIPLYNEDVRVQDEPVSVQRLKEAIRQADAVLIVSPEYNYSVPGVLKNALDWVSRPPTTCPLGHKPMSIMGASSGRIATARGQQHLRQVLLSVEAYVLPKPEVMIGNAADHFDDQGNLTDAKLKELVREHLAALVDWTQRLRA
jgi:chromate reductase